ncbi:MAG TPA: ATP-binding cassette domain-containing protein [Chthoniobacterales bacterium]|nr:ATP-binding cassette domain-containing protein [Chthoniobacterales bacterium]
MLELRNVSLAAPGGPDERWLLAEASASFSRGHLHAVVGPSGCGKSTMLKIIAGLHQPAEGSVFWDERNLDEQDFAPNEIGYVPQFGIAFDLMQVDESIDTSLRLRVGGLTPDERAARVGQILEETGLTDIADRRVGVLSGGQKRRLALALELVSEPLLLLCDEVTTGLDPKSEQEIVHLLRRIADSGDRTVISVTHSLRHIDLHDTVTVLYGGRVVYQGAPSLLTHYFQIETPDQLFPTLGLRSEEEWHALWTGHASHYGAHPKERQPAETKPTGFVRPSFGDQLRTLLHRRWNLFTRNRAQIGLQLALLFGFPCLVVIFAWNGLPQIQNLSTGASDTVKELLETAAFNLRAAKVASLVSGLVMFQVILLTLIGSNNSAREIAGERAIFEKEKFAGLRPASYIASKFVFLSALVIAQSVWMGVFVSTVCRFPGDLLSQIAFLTLTNAAMTFVCLAISSLTRSSENASLLSIYLVGFQLPLSGAILALPQVIGWITRPFISAFWGWSGYLQTMRDTRFYDVVRSMSQTELAGFELCIWVLLMHILAGLFVAYFGVQNSRWQ